MGYNGGVVYCDYAEPKSIRELQIEGIQAVKCGSKQDIKAFAIQNLNKDLFYVDSASENLQKELRYYVYDEKTGKPRKTNEDHLMDAMLYAIGSGDKFNGKYR
jgi:phage terminase large subunit